MYKVLILLVFFGLGIPCASAANTISFDPQTSQMVKDYSQNIRIVMDEVPDGLSGFNFTISVLDPKNSQITAVSFPTWSSLPKNSPVPSDSVVIQALDINKTDPTNELGEIKPGATNVLLGTITLSGNKVGTTNLSIQPNLISDDNGNIINPVINQGIINVVANDNKAPVINYVSLNDYTPNTGDSIFVTVDTTDNVGVSSVKANDVLLVQSGNMWSGSIIAVEGTHPVNVSSADAVGHVAWKNDTTYTATTPEIPDTELPVINSVTL